MKVNYKISLLILITLMSPVLHADLYSSLMTIKRIRVHDHATFFGTTVQPPGTCNNWGEFFTFDHKTESGKAYLSLLLTAKATNKGIVLWYKESTAPGTDQSTGCDDLTTAVMIAVGLP